MGGAWPLGCNLQTSHGGLPRLSEGVCVHPWGVRKSFDLICVFKSHLSELRRVEWRQQKEAREQGSYRSRPAERGGALDRTIDS